MSTISEKDKTDIRRFMGYPPVGTDGAYALLGVLINDAGVLEHRLNHLTDHEEKVVENFLTSLRELELSIPAAAANLDASALGPLTGNPYEIAQRINLFDAWRRRLCDFFLIPPGPALRGAGGRGRTFVV